MNEEVLSFIQGYVMGAQHSCNREVLECVIDAEFPTVNRETFSDLLQEAGRRLLARAERMQRDGENLRAVAACGGS